MAPFTALSEPGFILTWISLCAQAPLFDFKDGEKFELSDFVLFVCLFGIERKITFTERNTAFVCVFKEK